MLSCLYDNPRTLVLGRSDNWVVWHPLFEDFARYYGFTPHACQPYHPRTKGKVESGVKYVKRNALAGRRFSSWEELNRWLDAGVARWPTCESMGPPTNARVIGSRVSSSLPGCPATVPPRAAARAAGGQRRPGSRRRGTLLSPGRVCRRARERAGERRALRVLL